MRFPHDMLGGVPQRLLNLSVCVWSLWCAGAMPACAQPREDPMKRPRMDTNVPNQPPPGVGVVQQQSKPLYVQGVVVAALMGGAIWTVCRSSRRQ